MGSHQEWGRASPHEASTSEGTRPRQRAPSPHPAQFAYTKSKRNFWGEISPHILLVP